MHDDNPFAVWIAIKNGFIITVIAFALIWLLFGCAAIPRPADRLGGGLIIGDRASKLATAPRVLRAPADWDVPERIDNSVYCPPLENQGQNPWCAAYSMAELLQASYWREFGARHDFPETRIYSGAKLLDGISGGGTTLDAVQMAVVGEDYGVPYIPNLTNELVADLQDVIYAVHKYGLVLVGLNITDGWRNLNRDGSVGPGRLPLGGHAVLVSGYSMRDRTIWGPNWWGRGWGQEGYWRMTFDQFDQQLIYGYAVRVTWEKK